MGKFGRKKEEAGSGLLLGKIGRKKLHAIKVYRNQPKTVARKADRAHLNSKKSKRRALRGVAIPEVLKTGKRTNKKLLIACSQVKDLEAEEAAAVASECNMLA